MTNPTQSSPTPTIEKPRGLNLHWPVLITAVLALGVVWHYGVFKSKPKIVLVTSGDTPYWDQVEKGANEAARIYDVNLQVIRSKSIPEAQNEVVRGLIGKGYDGIAVSPINAQLQASVLTDVASGTTLVTFDSDAPVSRRLCFVGTDNYSAGRRAGEAVRRALPDGGGVIICLGSLEKENTQHRRQGLIDELLDRPFEPEHTLDPIDAKLKGDKYEIIATLADGSEPNIAVDLAAKALKENPNVKCIVGLLGYSAPAILDAAEQTGMTGKVQVIGFDNNEKTLAGIANGAVYATILQDQFGCGFHTVRLLAEAARGDQSGLPIFQRRTLPVELITKDNVSAVQGQMSGAAATTNPAQ